MNAHVCHTGQWCVGCFETMSACGHETLDTLPELLVDRTRVSLKPLARTLFQS